MNQPLEPISIPPAPPASKDKGWFAAVLPVALIAVCAELGIAVLNNSTLPVYFHEGLHLSMRVVALITIPFFLAEALFKSPLGVLADRWGRKPLMLGGTLITVITPLLMILLHSGPAAHLALLTLFAFGVLRLFDGLGGAALWPALYAYVGDVVAEKQRGAAMGLLNVAYMVALALSFLAGGAVDDTFGPVLTGDEHMRDAFHQIRHHLGQAGRHFVSRLRHPHSHAPLPFSADAFVPPIYKPEHYFPSFILASILFAVASLTVLLALRGKAGHAVQREHASEEKVTWAGFVASLKTVPEFLLLAFVTFFGIGCIALLVKVFAIDEFGMTEKQFGVLTLWPALVIAAIAVPIGHLADKWGKTRMVRVGFCLCALGLWGIPLMHRLGAGETGFIVSAGIIGIGFVAAFPAWLALLTSLSGEASRGTVIGAASTAQGIGMLLGVFVGSELYGHNHIAPFIAAPCFVTIGSLLALIFVRERTLQR